MHSNPVNATPDLLSITVLPNGVVTNTPAGAGYNDGDLRASIVVTPSLQSAGTLDAANFNRWPECLPNLQWSVTCNGHTANPSFETTVETTPNIRRYWDAIFGTGRRVSERRGKKAITDPSTWLATHNIVKVGNRHSLHRFYHANAHLLRKANRISETVAAQLSMANTAAPVTYLFPQLSPKISDELKAAKTANDLIVMLTAPDACHQAWLSRLASARKMLETDENETLRGCSLLALMAVCATDNAGVALPDVITQTKAAYANVPSETDFDTMQHYMETLLFQRRKPKMTAQTTLDIPDFHQSLGLLQSYPALLRPLGFVFDIVILRAGIADGDFTLSATFTCNDLPAALVQPVSNTTNVRLKGTSFFLVPQDATYIDEGMLALNPNALPDSRFVLVTEDTDGTAAKFMQSSNSDGRAAEYSDASPAALVVQDADDANMQRTALQAGQLDPTTIPPIATARTCGIALQQEDRLPTLQTGANAITTNAPTNSQQNLFAEQLVLGFRVDVMYKGVWYSLCERSTQQYLLGNPSGQQITWNPTNIAGLSADEGFVSLGATSTDTSDPNAANPTEQLHVHQTIFNWVGGSLALAPRPTPEPTTDAPAPAPSGEHRLYVYATYNDPKEHSLAPLRFNGIYTFRCRVVDLAGNSRPFVQGEIKLLDGTTPEMQVTFARQEPIRGPQFLLTRPLDPQNQPSEHIDRIVVRNGAEDDSAQDRILVPPRESLRFAELHGILKDDKLPPTAFGNRALTKKGAFPSTRLALKQQWIEGPKPKPNAKNSELSDPIFITMDSAGRVSSPYYPDPLANYIRVEAWLLSDRPPLGTLLGRPGKEAIWLEINPGNIWPELLPARIQLVASEGDGPVKIEAMSLPLNRKNPLDQAPTVTVTLPPAATMILNISSAAVPGDGPSPHRPIATDVAAYHRAVYYAKTQALPAGESYEFLSQTTSNAYVDGALPPVTPPATMTLVHAVPKPVAEPYLGPNFTVIRNMTETNGQVSGDIFAHWLSTGKITCHATYTNMVDDPKNPAPVYQTYSEAAFDLTPATTPAGANAPDPLAPASVYPRALKGLVHKFRDTRAHDVIYTLEASTRFREYYPVNETDANFSIRNTTKFPVKVKSSVRPSAVSIAYILPTFTWAHSGDPRNPVLQRVAGVRVYFNPPFGLSGNRECVCAVLATAQNPTAAEDQPMVSRWAADPIRNSAGLPTTVIETTQIGDPGDSTNGTVALLAEGGLAEVNIFAVTHAPERRLWFADIPFRAPDPLNLPFFRLALARWQPDGLFDMAHATPLEARISNVVFADFMQLAPGRWASVSKRSNTHYTITLSGFFAPPSGEPITSSITVDLQSRWYAMGIDLGWRTIAPEKSSSNPSSGGTPMFTYRAPTVDSPIPQWTIAVHLPQSALFRKYRVLVREREQFAAPENGNGPAVVPSRPVFTQFIDLP